MQIVVSWTVLYIMVGLGLGLGLGFNVMVLWWVMRVTYLWTQNPIYNVPQE